MGTLIRGVAFAAFLGLVVAAALRVARPGRGDPVHAVLALLVWSALLVVAYVLFLSLFHALTPAALLVASVVGWATVRAIARAPCESKGDVAADPAQPARAHPPRSDTARAIALCSPAVVFGLASAVTILSAPEPGADNLAYHLPRLGYWIERRAVEPFVAGNVRAGSFAPIGNVLQLPPVLFLGTDLPCGLVQLVSAYGAAFAILGIARLRGASRLASAAAALAWFAIPAVAIQAVLSQVDLTVAFFSAAAVYFALRLGLSGSADDALAGVIAAALAVGTKANAAVIGVPVAAYCAWHLWLRSWRAVAAGVGAGAIASALPYVVADGFVWGHPSGPLSVQWTVADPGLTTAVKNAAFAFAPALHWEWLRTHPGAPVPGLRDALTRDGLGLCWLALASVAALVVVLGGGSRREHAGSARGWLRLELLGLATMAISFVVLRHTPSVGRYVLPSAAILTVAVAYAADALGRSHPWAARALVAVVFLSATLVLGLQAAANWRGRHPQGRALAEAERYGAPLVPVARAVGELGTGGLRIGVVTSQYFAERLFFGDRFQHAVVPLSYEAPTTLEALEEKRLDAVWVSTPEGCVVQLFRREFQRPESVRAETYAFRPTVWGYDQDFVDAHSESTYFVDVRPTIRVLTADGSPWRPVISLPDGVLFARGGPREGREASAATVPCT